MKKSVHYILMIALLTMTSCEKFISIDDPADRIVTASLFQEEATAKSAILGIYAKMARQDLTGGAITINTGLGSDEMFYTGTVQNIMQFSDNSLAPDNSIISANFWRNGYEVIYASNACIEGLTDNTFIPETARNQLLGEAYFLRAFNYWYLNRLFGGVPLILTTADYEANAQMARNSESENDMQILNDLLAAKDLLQPEYPSAGRLRVNYFTVMAMLSRYYLYAERWSDAEAAANEVLASPNYTLEPAANSFLINSKEAIWQLATDQASFTVIEANRFIPSNIATIRPQYAITDDLYDSFEVGDARKTTWINAKTVAGTVYRYPFKYKVRALSNPKAEALIMLRVSEVLLNRAEARARQNKAAALDDLNELRMHRGSLSSLSDLDAQALIAAIQRERRVEFFAEFAARWFDLKRTGQIDAVLGAKKAGWQSSDALYPIPQSEMLLNPNLQPN